MKKFKMFVDMDKEEEYLNGMAKSGFVLKKYGFFGVYTFDKEDSVDLNYRVDYRTFKNKRQFEEYKILFEDAGWEHVSGTQLSLSGGQYFIPKLSNIGLPDIFSDTESKLARYKRFIDQCIGSCVCILIYMFSMLKTNNLRYLTPGLWEKNGDDFWRAFIIETPAVVLRFLPFIILLILSIMYGNRAFRAKKMYNKSVTENKNNCL
ncbi:DUF2812 domain-containing protein [Clostridium sp.]|uniref:DUF2812 domain-containing protein n=1 Tax=Clostridium sp. TaxID=1506 RepID=UPI003D6D0DA6